MKRTTILTFFAVTSFLIVPLGSSIGNSHRQRPKKKCPTVEVKGPSKSKALKNISYRTKVKGFSGATPPLFKWSVVGGVLLEGQDSDVITVEPQAREVRATLRIENLPADCRSNSDTVVTRITDVPWVHPPPIVSAIKAFPPVIVRRCPAGTKSDTCAVTGDEVQLRADAAAQIARTLLFTWSVPVGRLKGEGKAIIWDLLGVPSGTYKVTVEVGYFDLVSAESTTVTVTDCNDCKPVPATDAAKPSSRPLPPRVTSRVRLRPTDTLH